MAFVIVTYNPAPSPEVRAEIRDIAAVWASEDRTNGQFLSNPPHPPEVGSYRVIREFVTLADAEEWLNDIILTKTSPATYSIQADI